MNSKEFEFKLAKLANEASKEELITKEIPKKKKYHIADMDIIFDKEISQEEMEIKVFNALRSVGVIGHRGCPN